MIRKYSLVLTLFLVLPGSSLAEEVLFLVGIHYCPATPEYEYHVLTSDPEVIAMCRQELALPEA